MIICTHVHKGVPHIGPAYDAETQFHEDVWGKQRVEHTGTHTHTHTKEGGSEQKIWEQRIVGAVSLGVVTGVRAESASDSEAVLHNASQQSLYLGDSSNPSLSLLSFIPSPRSHLIFLMFSVCFVSFPLPLPPCFSHLYFIQAQRLDSACIHFFFFYLHTSEGSQYNLSATGGHWESRDI